MSRKTREQKREEEKRIIAELEDALKNNAIEKEETLLEKADFYGEELPDTLHCKRCKTKLDKGVCPLCGYRIYVPIRKEKRDKIRTVVAVVSMAIFIVLFLVLQFKKA